MTDQGPLGRPPRGASVPGGAPRGAGPQLICVHCAASPALPPLHTPRPSALAAPTAALAMDDSNVFAMNDA